MRKLVLLIYFLPVIAAAQEKGIRFENESSWTAIIEKARASGKYIFLDCYATWCVPCKAMDREVYAKDEVGEYFNEQYISVKVQMDTGKNDNSTTRNWYQTAREIQTRYKVNSFPTYLFFSSNGTLVHEAVGYKPAGQFLSIGRDAIDTSKQFHFLVSKYMKGERNYAVMPYLARYSLSLGLNDLANKFSKDYVENYLNRLNRDQIYTKENLEFMASFVQSSMEVSFSFFYKNGQQVDKILNRPGFSRKVVDRIITKEEITPALLVAKDKSKEPEWSFIEKKINHGFGEIYVEKNLTDAKVRWYRFKKDWKLFTKNSIRLIEKSIPDTAADFETCYIINNLLWDAVFVHGEDKEDFDKGIRRMKLIVDAYPDDAAYLDTYANILYKSGRKQEGIAAEEKAILLSKGADKDMLRSLEKMKSGQPTW